MRFANVDLPAFGGPYKPSFTLFLFLKMLRKKLLNHSCMLTLFKPPDFLGGAGCLYKDLVFG